MSTIAFDVDGTLITFDDQPRREIINMLIALSSAGNEITVWSGGGKEYASVWVRRLFLDRFVTHIDEKPLHAAKEGLGPFVDIAFDDEAVDLGKINVRLPCTP